MFVKIVLFAFLVLILASCGDDSSSTQSGNGQGTDQQTSICTNCRIFATAAVYNGNLGGISGADQKCANDTNNPKDGGLFKAVIVGSTRRACTSAYCGSSGINENLNWVMKANTTYSDLNGNALFSTNASAIPEFPVFFNAQILTTDKIWTGLEVADNDGFTAAGAWLTGETCDDWQDSDAPGGRYGENMITQPGRDYLGFAYMTEACTNTNSLYCVEQ